MKSTTKVSSIKYREILNTIEKIASINNENEDNQALNDIYKIAHVFGNHCGVHPDWREEYEQIKDNLKNY